VPIELFLTETEARAFPFSSSRRRLSELIDDYGEAGSNGLAAGMADVDEALLAPAPVDCELPRRGHDPAVAIWGYARSSLVRFGRRVTAISTAVAIESRDSPEARPGVEEALRSAGTAWTSKRLKRLGSVAGEFWLTGQPSMNTQPHALNLRLLTAARSREQFRALESVTDRHAVTRASGGLPKTPASWGRVVFVNNPNEVPEGIPADSFQEIALDVADRRLTVRAHVTQRKMLGTDTRYLVIFVCGGPFEGEVAGAIDALLKRGLEHALASDWLATRAEQVNDRQAEFMAELLDEETVTIRVENLRQQLGLLRYTFVDELEFAWDYEINQQPGAEELHGLIDRAMRLTHRWKRELTRFERLASIAAVAPSAGLAQNRAQIQIPEIIPGLKEEKNLFSQVAMWWRYRGRLRRGPVEEAESRVPALQRPGPRRGDVPVGAREIELHPFRNRPALFAELSASIALTSFMTAASAVFLGVVLQKGERTTLPMDVLFLFIATFGFLFATLIYANASGRLARHGTFGYESQVEIANRVSEYLGVFPLLVAIPLSVSRFLEAGPIPWAVAGLALLATIAYHYVRGASLLERDISDHRIGSDWQRQVIFVPLLAMLMTVTFLGQLLHSGAMEIVGAVGFGVLSLLMVLLSAMLPERTNPQEYLVDDWDALSDETPDLPIEPDRSPPTSPAR
jgi:hypothetical protein